MEIGSAKIQINQDHLFTVSGKEHAEVRTDEGFSASSLSTADCAYMWH